MAKPSKFEGLLRSITKDVVDHPRDLTRHLSERLQISRVATNRYITRLETEGWIARSGPLTHPVFSLGYMRRVSHLYDLDGLEEDIVWARDFMPYFNLSPNVQHIVNNGFTEMLNNAIDHSAGKSVFIWATQNEDDFQLIISDDGVGIFAKIAAALNLPDMRQALFELSKGKFTTDPSKHSGEGVFFTSRMFDSFQINANGLQFSHSNHLPNDWLRETKGVFTEGTAVMMQIAAESERKAADVYAQFTNAPEDFDFSKTVVPMKLAKFGDELLVSRSQAKRLIARFDRFRTVILDFDGVQEIGQAFADELFRVYANSQPNVELLPKNMTTQVERMWLRARLPVM
ncbi:STAS-like domain-containing protein [Propionivibrio sp.]|uniref:STAS-like domain-containing protein n=1 Tax=Propionivibrio sp. TaxID=2212460 RepID=UPI003BF39DAF